MNVYVLTSVFDAEVSVTVYSEENRKQAEEDFLKLFRDELENSVGTDSADKFDFTESYNDVYDWESIYYSPESQFSFIDNGYNVVLELCEVDS